MCVLLRARALHRVIVQRHMHGAAPRASVHLLRTRDAHHAIARNTAYARLVAVHHDHELCSKLDQG